MDWGTLLSLPARGTHVLPTAWPVAKTASVWPAGGDNPLSASDASAHGARSIANPPDIRHEIKILDGDTFFISDERGDVPQSGPFGLFFRDTRHLSRFALVVRAGSGGRALRPGPRLWQATGQDPYVERWAPSLERHRRKT